MQRATVGPFHRSRPPTPLRDDSEEKEIFKIPQKFTEFQVELLMRQVARYRGKRLSVHLQERARDCLAWRIRMTTQSRPIRIMNQKKENFEEFVRILSNFGGAGFCQKDT